MFLLSAPEAVQQELAEAVVAEVVAAEVVAAETVAAHSSAEAVAMQASEPARRKPQWRVWPKLCLWQQAMVGKARA